MTASKTPQRQWRDYRTAKGGRPVKKFIDELTDEETADVVAGMKEIALAEGRLRDWRSRGAIKRRRAETPKKSQ